MKVNKINFILFILFICFLLVQGQTVEFKPEQKLQLFNNDSTFAIINWSGDTLKYYTKNMAIDTSAKLLFEYVLKYRNDRIGELKAKIKRLEKELAILKNR